MLIALAAWQLRGRGRRAVVQRERRKAEILRERAREQHLAADEAEARAQDWIRTGADMRYSEATDDGRPTGTAPRATGAGRLDISAS